MEKSILHILQNISFCKIISSAKDAEFELNGQRNPCCASLHRKTKEKQHSEMQKHILGEQPLNDERIIIFIF